MAIFAPGAALAVPLIGSGANLDPTGLPISTPPGEGWSLTTSGGVVSGSWPGTVLSPWQGPISGTGIVPNSSSSGSSSLDFTGLNHGSMPSSSILILSDLDGGSGFEEVTFTAYDAVGTPITVPWLDEPLSVNGFLAGTLGAMPGWEWTGSSYIFTGSTFGPNPSIGVYLATNEDIFSLDIDKSATPFGLSFLAPVPEPSTALLLGLGLAALSRTRRD